MTITQLLELPTASLEAMTDAQLEEVLKKYWPDARPDGGRSAQLDMLTELHEKLKGIQAAASVPPAEPRQTMDALEL